MPMDRQESHRLFVRALQHEPIRCGQQGCPGPVETVDQSQTRDRVKTFVMHCERCGWQDRVSGVEQATPPWDNASLELMADEHLMHQQPVCPYDDTPVVFISMPNPRRKAKYRVACFYCGRQTEMDWPPPESKR
ncbi:hypothetical protein FBQ96_12800 [Nitrospirales bacterium NOB]|nr:hypothetical protein [Nitrospirota bacterium]MCE7966818.1 hypothetical protein [Nitrospira sp. NTP2]MCK6492599.1 hypothetical protein [Nitrospira sp.]MDL1890433.1 hypothetical protein [Nitrospirales bacterium NOB]MEB2337731.1 hypothetical protein [Nitrospirales bacterium]